MLEALTPRLNSFPDAGYVLACALRGVPTRRRESPAARRIQDWLNQRDGEMIRVECAGHLWFFVFSSVRVVRANYRMNIGSILSKSTPSFFSYIYGGEDVR